MRLGQNTSREVFLAFSTLCVQQAIEQVALNLYCISMNVIQMSVAIILDIGLSCVIKEAGAHKTCAHYRGYGYRYVFVYS